MTLMSGNKLRLDKKIIWLLKEHYGIDEDSIFYNNKYDELESLLKSLEDYEIK